VSNVFVTGVTGFIGSHLAGALSRRGHRVAGSTSRDAGLLAQTPGVERKVALRLGDDVDADFARGFDAVVHCAWDLRPNTGSANVGGTERIADAFRGVGAFQLFISTYSAHAGAATAYGTTKRDVQEWMLKRGHAAARPGIVIGPGGIYQRMAQTLAHHRVVPLIDGGRDPVPIIAIADLCEALVAIVEQRRTGPFNVFNPDLVPLRDVLFEIRTQARARTLLVPVPAPLVLAPVWIAGKFGVKLPLDADNVRALRANRSVRDRSDLQAFVRQPMTLSEMVRAARGDGSL